jgi:hypothetical protein
MSNIVFAAMIFLATTGLAQQTTKQIPSPAKPVSPVKGATLPRPMTDQLEKRVSELEKEIQDLKESHAWLQDYAVQQISGLQHPTASFDPSSPGPYQLIDGSIGPMLVSIGKIEQYLDGYSVQLQIGNILAASLNGFKVSAKWSRRYKKEDGNYFDWYKSRKTKDFSFTGTLASGRWNTLEVILPDTKPSEFGYLEISLDTNTVSMTKSPVAQ